MEPGVEFYTALAKARHEMGKVIKTKDGQIGQQKYKYANLEAVNDATDDALYDNDIFVWFLPGDYADGMAFVEYEIVHLPTGQKVNRMAAMPCDPKAQPVGSAHTYLRRYVKLGLLDMVTEDDDGKSANQEARPRASLADVARHTPGVTPVASRPSSAATGAFSLPVLKDLAMSIEVQYPTIGLVGAYLATPQQSLTPKPVNEADLWAYQEANEGLTPMALLVHAADWYAAHGTNEEFRVKAEEWVAARS